MTARVGRAAAPGRICLAGESLDWMTGGPSVVAAISLRTTASAHLADTCPELTIRSGPPINASRTIATAELGELADDRLAYVQAVAYLAGSSWPTPPAGALHLRSELPVGAGVSSSASATVATAAALLTAAHGVPPAPDTAARIAYLAERTAGSGAGWMDFLAVAHGGVNLIQATDPPAVALLADRLHIPVVLIDTLTRRSTRTLLAAKRTRWQNHDPDLLAYVDTAQLLVAKLADALRTPKPDHRKIGQLVTQAHRLLGERVGCSTALIDACVDRCLSAGAYGAKLTGSGHGGCLFALVPPDRVEAVLSALQPLPVEAVVLDGTDPGGVEATSEAHRFEEDSVDA
jgi:mevalonate kinase